MKIADLYSSYNGNAPYSVEHISGSGSSRSYYRFIPEKGGITMIGCEGRDIEENDAFLYLSRHFKSKGLPVPEIYAVSEDRSCYLMEDLGSMSLFEAISTGRSSGIFQPEEIQLLEKAIRILPDFQFLGSEGIDFNLCYPEKEMDRRMVMWDLNYFKYCFLKTSGVEFNESRLEDDFDALATLLTDYEGDTFMYRDFQSRNVIIGDDGNPYFIDYQGGRRGPIFYDVASFLWQAKARLTDELREHLIDSYIESASRFVVIDKADFMRQLDVMVLFRTLQVLGAYGFRGLIEKKSHFIESIPYALNTIRQLLDRGVVKRLPTLEESLIRLVSLPKFTRKDITEGGLGVKVTSFSYKRGIPDDYSGNGGGYVFDCRWLHNPGRYPEYKQLTGWDEPVIKFLEETGEIQPWLESVDAILDATVEKYKKRGFTSLTIAFGCTGGRHRSVYSAEHVANRINERFNVEVELVHRERGITKLLPRR